MKHIDRQFPPHTRPKKQADRRGIPPRTPPAAPSEPHASQSDGATRNQISGQDFRRKKFEL